MKKEFKRIWIPLWLHEHKWLTLLQRCLIAEICQLTCDGKECYASNQYFADIFCCSPGHIANTISEIRGLYLTVVASGNRRKIRVIASPTDEAELHLRMKQIRSKNTTKKSVVSPTDEAPLHPQMNGASPTDDDRKRVSNVRVEGLYCSATAEPPAPEKTRTPKRKSERPDIATGGLAAAGRVVEYLNQKALRNFPVNGKMSKTTSKMILARLNDGCTEEQMKLVIDNRCSNWLGDAKMQEYLRPSTLFSQTNFVNYLEEATRSSGGTQNGPVYDIHLSNEREKSYKGFWEKTVETLPNIAKSVRFFTASEYVGFFADEPAFSPKIWSKYQGDMRRSKIRQALTTLENDPQRNRTAPTGLCDYLKKWFIDERDGNH